MTDLRRTLARTVTRSGIALHTGKHTRVEISAAPLGEGISFFRADLEGRPRIQAAPHFVADTSRSTMLAHEGASVQTVEHLLASLFALGITDANIYVLGPELPILDGSALPFAEAIHDAGAVILGEAEPRLSLMDPIWIPQGNSFVSAIPSSELRFSCGIRFDQTPIGEQWASFLPADGHFAHTLAPARTFARVLEIEALRARGLIQGGSLDVALVCNETEWLNGPLRFPNEPARHKLLDWIGDLSLLGARLPVAHYVAFCAGHALHVKLAKRLAELSPFPS